MKEKVGIRGKRKKRLLNATTIITLIAAGYIAGAINGYITYKRKTHNDLKIKTTLANILDNTPDSITTTTTAKDICALFIVTDEKGIRYKPIQNGVTRLKKIGTPENNIILLTPSLRTQSGQSKVKQVFEHIQKHMKPEDNFVLFIEGHGHQYKNMRSDVGGISSDFISDMIETLPQEVQKLCMIESCGAGKFLDITDGNNTTIITSSDDEKSSFGNIKDGMIGYLLLELSKNPYEPLEKIYQKAKNEYTKSLPYKIYPFSHTGMVGSRKMLEKPFGHNH